VRSILSLLWYNENVQALVNLSLYSFEDDKSEENNVDKITK